MVSKFKKPRHVMMLVKAGAAVDAFIDQLVRGLVGGREEGREKEREEGRKQKGQRSLVPNPSQIWSAN